MSDETSIATTSAATTSPSTPANVQGSTSAVTTTSTFESVVLPKASMKGRVAVVALRVGLFDKLQGAKLAKDMKNLAKLAREGAVLDFDSFTKALEVLHVARGVVGSDDDTIRAILPHIVVSLVEVLRYGRDRKSTLQLRSSSALAHSSKSSAWPRIAIMPLIEPEPPSTLPRG